MARMPVEGHRREDSIFEQRGATAAFGTLVCAGCPLSGRRDDAQDRGRNPIGLRANFRKNIRHAGRNFAIKTPSSNEL